MSEKQPRLARFVEERIMIQQINEDEAKQESSKQGVSIRLDVGTLRGIDFMAKELDVSRQALLLEIVSSGFKDVVEAWCDQHGDGAQDAHKKVREVMSFREGDL